MPELMDPRFRRESGVLFHPHTFSLENQALTQEISRENYQSHNGTHSSLDTAGSSASAIRFVSRAILVGNTPARNLAGDQLAQARGEPPEFRVVVSEVPVHAFRPRRFYRSQSATMTWTRISTGTPALRASSRNWWKASRLKPSWRQEITFPVMPSS